MCNLFASLTSGQAEVCPRARAQETSMTEKTPLLAFADLLYRHEYSLAERSERMGRFLTSSSINLAAARALIDEEAQTNPVRAIPRRAVPGPVTGALGDMRQARGRVAACSRLWYRPRHPDLWKVISGIRLQTPACRGGLPAEETAQRFGSSYHRYVDLDFEFLGQAMPESQGEWDVVVFAEVIDMFVHHRPNRLPTCCRCCGLAAT